MRLRVTEPSPAPNEPGNRVTSYRVALIVAGIAVVAGCLIWALGLPHSFNAKSRTKDTDAADSAATAKTTEAIPASVNPTPAGETSADNSPTPAEAAKSVRFVAQGFPPMKEQADEWIATVRERADGGSADAQFEMGSFYEFGLGSLSPDQVTALEWYQKAATQGHALAKEGVEDLSPSAAQPSSDEPEALRLDMRRLARQSKGTNGMLDDMHAKAMDAVKRIKQ